MQLYVNPDRLTTATGDTLIDVNTGSYGTATTNLDEFIPEDGEPGFVFIGNDTYRVASLHKAHWQKQEIISRRHAKRAYNSTRQSDRRYRNVAYKTN